MKPLGQGRARNGDSIPRDRCLCGLLTGQKKGLLPLIRSELEDACLRCKTDGGVASDSSGFGASLRKRDPSAR